MSRRYDIDYRVEPIGSGEECFRCASKALFAWKSFDHSWLDLCWPSAAIEEGTTVAVLVRSMGVWCLNLCRIVYVIEPDETTPICRLGFGYGTLERHVESGEERFWLDWDRRRGTVSFGMCAFSRPRHPLIRLGRFHARRLQQSFARASMQRMRDVCAPCTD